MVLMWCRCGVRCLVVLVHVGSGREESSDSGDIPRYILPPCNLLSCPTDVPKLQPHPGLEKKEEDDDEDEYDDGSSVKKQANKNRVQSGPRTPNPYASDNSSLMFPILVAFGVFIPTLFCLCRL